MYRDRVAVFLSETFKSLTSEFSSMVHGIIKSKSIQITMPFETLLGQKGPL